MSLLIPTVYLLLFFFNVPAPTEIYTLSLHDALPISATARATSVGPASGTRPMTSCVAGSMTSSAADASDDVNSPLMRSEEHTSELQSHHDLVCRLLLEKKKKKQTK